MKTITALLALAALTLAVSGCGGSTSAPTPATRNVTWEGHNPPPVK